MEGGCYCGAVRYELSEKPVLKAQCHCRECQYISGGGPNYFMVVPESGFAYTQGSSKQYKRPDLDQPVTREFCPDCGTHLTTLLKSRGLVVIKIGTLDDPATVYRGPVMAIYMKDAQPFHLVPEGLPTFEGTVPRS